MKCYLRAFLFTKGRMKEPLVFTRLLQFIDFCILEGPDLEQVLIIESPLKIKKLFRWVPILLTVV